MKPYVTRLPFSHLVVVYNTHEQEKSVLTCDVIVIELFMYLMKKRREGGSVNMVEAQWFMNLEVWKLKERKNVMTSMIV